MMKKKMHWNLMGCAALALVGGMLAAPALAAEPAAAGANPVTLTAVSTSAAARTAVDAEGAKTAALKEAGVSAADVEWIRVESDYEDGRLEYEVEFFADNCKYEADVDADTGSLRSFERKSIRRGTNQGSTDIGEAEAKAAALDHAGVEEEDTVFLYAERGREDGVRIYEVEFFAGDREYDYEVDAATGEILAFDCEIEWYAGAGESSEYLSAEAVKAIVEKTAGTTGVYTEFQMEMDDGRLVYEGELRSGRMEYEFEIDARTGGILDWDADRD